MPQCESIAADIAAAAAAAVSLARAAWLDCNPLCAQVMDEREELRRAVAWLAANATFDVDARVGGCGGWRRGWLARWTITAPRPRVIMLGAQAARVHMTPLASVSTQSVLDMALLGRCTCLS